MHGFACYRVTLLIAVSVDAAWLHVLGMCMWGAAWSDGPARYGMVQSMQACLQEQSSDGHMRMMGTACYHMSTNAHEALFYVALLARATQ